MKPRILIVKLGAIGDVIMAIPAAYELYLQGYAIDWVCGLAVLPLLRCYPWIESLLVDDRAMVFGGKTAKLAALAGIWKQLAGRRYELCATLYYDPRYRLISLPVRARRRLSLSHADRNLRLLHGRHHTDEFARILLGRRDDVTPVALSPVRAVNLPASPLTRVPGRRRVVMAPAGAKNTVSEDILRRWQPESYVAVAQALIEQGIEVVLIGGPDDRWVQPYFGGMQLTDLIGQLPIPRTLALLDEADVFVTHDTGPLHMAGITRVAIVGIFGPTDPRGRLPQRLGTVAIWGGEGFACRPCYDAHSYAPCSDNGCMRQVSPAMVLAEVQAALARQTVGAPQPPRVIVPESTVVSA